MICFRLVSVSCTILYIFMGKKAVYSFVRAQVVALHDAGFNQVQLSKQLNISCCCVQNAINKYKYVGICENAKRSTVKKSLMNSVFGI